MNPRLKSILNILKAVHGNLQAAHGYFGTGLVSGLFLSDTVR